VTLRTCPDFKYELEQVWLPVSENILAWEEDFHQLMLDDEIRMKSYEHAIKELVKPGMTVLDLGTGTGILGLWALQAGAQYLYAIDVNAAVIPKAIASFEAAGFAGKFEVFHGLSYDITLPRKVDLIISEIIGNLGDNEDFVPILNDAHKRFLNPTGRMLPRRVCSHIVPVCAVKAHQQVAAQQCRTLNVNYSLAALMQRLAVKSPFNLYYDTIIPPGRYLSEPKIANECLFDGNDQAVYTVELEFVLNTHGMLTGFKGSFVAQLSELIALDISGGDIDGRTTSDSWKHCYLPIEEPIDVQQGDRVHLRYARSYPTHRESPFRQCYRWSGTTTRQGRVIGAFDQSTG
jgi:2-polyprenyl-3-methyl-5-hydroxy-6-metoxy-1,4-benzoquinol methylase